MIVPSPYRNLKLFPLQESKCSGQYTQRRRVIDLMLCLGLKDEATRLLLETEPSNENFYSDHLLACLVASTEVAETGTPHSTTKLVATNLIAEGKLWQGVQLLCLINKVHLTIIEISFVVKKIRLVFEEHRKKLFC